MTVGDLFVGLLVCATVSWVVRIICRTVVRCAEIEHERYRS